MCIFSLILAQLDCKHSCPHNRGMIQSPENSLIRNYRSFLKYSFCEDFFSSSLLSLTPFPSYSPIPRKSLSLSRGRKCFSFTCASVQIHPEDLGLNSRKLSSLTSLFYHNNYFIVCSFRVKRIIKFPWLI